MAAQDRKTVTPGTATPPSASPSATALTAPAPSYPPASMQLSPLPGNRPIADNTTEDVDDMLGYLD